MAAAGGEFLRLGQIDAEQGEAARNAEIPRSVGRVGGAWAGAKVGGALGAMTGPAAPIATPAGALIGGGVGYAFGDDAADKVTEAAGRMRYASRDPKHYTDPAFQATAAAAAPPDIKFRDESTPPDSMFRRPAPPDIKFRDESTPPDSMFRKSAAQAAAEKAASQNASAEAARINAPPERVTAYGFQDANKAEAAGMRSAARIQDYGANARSTITGNALNGISGDTNELMRRMHNDLTSYTLKGFPSLRAQRAEMWNGLISQANGVTAKGADNAAAADMQGMQAANESQRAFSDRRNKVDMFNVGTSEERRAGDLDRQQKLIESVLGGGVRRRGETPQSYADIAKGFGGDYTAAAQSVLRNKAAAGEDLTDDPLATMALTNLSDEVLAGNGRMARRGIGGTTFFGAGADGPVDANPLNYTRQERGYFDRLGSALWPWGVKPSDYLYADKAGNKRYRDTPLFSDDPVLDKQIRDRIAAGTGYKE